MPMSYFLIVTIVNLLSCAHVSPHSLKAALNPGCPECPKNMSVLAISYQGVHSSAHYVISLPVNKGVPSILLSTGRINSTLQFNWTSILNSDSSQPAVFLEDSSFYGLTFTHLYQYRDVLDIASVSAYTEDVKKILTKDCFWFLDHFDAVPDSSSGLLSVVLKCNDFLQGNLMDKKGEIEIQFTFSEKDQSSRSAPYTLLVGGLSVRIKFILRRLNGRWKETRWSIGLALVSNVTLPPDAPFASSTCVSVDDEASPGTFKNVLISLSNNSYAAWKAVSYVNESSAELKSSRATSMSSQSPIDMQTRNMIIKYSFLPFIYGANLYVSRLVNISFGDPGDGFYQASRYIHWSLDLGLSTPPRTHFSVLVWVAIISTTAVLLLAIGLFTLVAIWRFCLRRPSYEVYERSPLTDSVDEQNPI